VTEGQLVNKFTYVYGEHNVHFLVHNSMTAYVSVIQANSVNSFTSHFFLRSNLMLSCRPFHLLHGTVI